jgi:predicted phosphodiesterase
MIYKYKNLLLAVAFIAVLGCVNAQPSQIHLSWSGEKAKTNSTMTVLWISDNLQTPEFVKYGTNTANLTMAKAQELIAEGHSFHKVFLKNLRHSTTYIYRCGSDASGWSENYTFKTAPNTGERKTFKVGVFGDTQNNDFNEQFEKTTQIVGHILLLKPNLTLHMGDMVENGSRMPYWLNFLKIAQPLNANSPMMQTLGNHDIENLQGENFQKPFPSFYQLFSLPENGLDYSFDYGNTHFVCIFSGLAKAASEKGLLRYAPSSTEYNWLEKDLSKAHSNPRIDWIVAYTHYPLYAFGVSGVQQWREAITPLFDKYHVDICLSGHRHVYERHHSVKAGFSVPEGKGTVYITNGTAGGSPQGLGGKEMPTMAFTSSEKMYNYALMTIDQIKLIYEVFDLNGKKIDELIITKH